MKESILIGLHGKRSLRKSLRDFCEGRGYDVDIAEGTESMVEMVSRKEYDRYLMRLNLDSLWYDDITPAITVYKRVRCRAESGEAKFLGFGTDKAVRKAQAEGIPATRLLDCLDDFLGEENGRN